MDGLTWDCRRRRFVSVRASGWRVRVLVGGDDEERRNGAVKCGNEGVNARSER